MAQVAPIPMGAPGALPARPIAAPLETVRYADHAPAGPEYAQYYAPPASRNRFIIGGLIAWSGALMGGLLVLERRRLTALAIGGTTLLAGLVLMIGAQ